MLLGPQGSGKGTQAKRIAEEYGIPHIATGDMLRAAIAEGTDTGKKIEPIYNRGDLVPDDLMIELIRERLQQDDAKDGFVLDGFPRNHAQAEALDEMLREIGREPDVVFALQVSDDVSRGRLLERSRLEGRDDDTPEVIDNRLRIYHEQTEPLVEYYRTRGHVVPIRGDRSIAEVFAEIQNALEHIEARA